MKNVLIAAIAVLALASLAGRGDAEEYGECRARCNHDFAACMNPARNTTADSADSSREAIQKRTALPKQTADHNAECEEVLQECHADCKDLRQEKQK